METDDDISGSDKNLCHRQPRQLIFQQSQPSKCNKHHLQPHFTRAGLAYRSQGSSRSRHCRSRSRRRASPSSTDHRSSSSRSARRHRRARRRHIRRAHQEPIRRNRLTQARLLHKMREIEANAVEGRSGQICEERDVVGRDRELGGLGV
jgi:hypothetical protein